MHKRLELTRSDRLLYKLSCVIIYTQPCTRIDGGVSRIYCACPVGTHFIAFSSVDSRYTLILYTTPVPFSLSPRFGVTRKARFFVIN